MVEIGEPIFLSNLLLYPLHGEDRGNGFSVLDEIQDQVGIEELPEAQVDQIMVDNRSDRPLLMIDGEEIIGAFQDRVVATSTILEPHTKSEVPTTCVERNRWEGNKLFDSGRTCSFPSVRAVIARASIRGQSFQDEVWDEIDHKLASTRTISKTSSMHDMYQTLKDELDRYVSESGGIDGHGIVATCGSKILCLDYFKSQELFAKFREKLIRSYGLEVIDKKNPTVQVKIDGFVKKVMEGRWRRFENNGQSQIEALSNKKIAARRLRYQDNLIHVSAFPIG